MDCKSFNCLTNSLTDTSCSAIICCVNKIINVFFLCLWKNLTKFLFYQCCNYSVKGTIERYKKATSDSPNTGSISEANAQVCNFYKTVNFFDCGFNSIFLDHVNNPIYRKIKNLYDCQCRFSYLSVAYL